MCSVAYLWLQLTIQVNKGMFSYYLASIWKCDILKYSNLIVQFCICSTGLSFNSVPSLQCKPLLFLFNKSITVVAESTTLLSVLKFPYL